MHQRFYTALALHDLVNEVPLTVVSTKYGASKGKKFFCSSMFVLRIHNIDDCRHASESSASRVYLRRDGDRVLPQVGLAQHGTAAGTVPGKDELILKVVQTSCSMLL